MPLSFGALDIPYAAGVTENAIHQAVRRIWDVVASAQGERATAARRTGRILAPDGKYEHMPLRLADVDPADVAALAKMATIFGDPHAPGHVRQEAGQKVSPGSQTPPVPLCAGFRRSGELRQMAAQETSGRSG